MTTKDTKKVKEVEKAKISLEHKEVAEKSEKKTAVKPSSKSVTGRYIEAIGRRKTSTARVRITEGSKEGISINGKSLAVYFPTAELQSIVNTATSKSKIPAKFNITVVVKGGGVHSQAESVRHGISRALVAHSEESRPRLKKLGFLKRDPRSKERRKFGLKKARKASQWSKR